MICTLTSGTAWVQGARLLGATLGLALAPAVLAQAVDAPNADAVRVLISPAQETTLVAPMAGNIKTLPISLGSAFKQNDILMGFDCAEGAAKSRIARAELRAARENHQAKTRLRSLDAAGDVEVNLAAADVEKSAGQVELARVQTEFCSIKAPFSGRVARLHIKQYQGVSPGAPLVDLISDGPLKIRVNAPSKWLARLQVGNAFEIAVDETGKRYPAKVSAVGARIDAAAQAIEIEGQLDGEFPELLAGMSGTIYFPDAP